MDDPSEDAHGRVHVPTQATWQRACSHRARALPRSRSSAPASRSCMRLMGSWKQRRNMAEVPSRSGATKDTVA
jgi:hypothetical protein